MTVMTVDYNAAIGSTIHQILLDTASAVYKSSDGAIEFVPKERLTDTECIIQVKGN